MNFREETKSCGREREEIKKEKSVRRKEGKEK